MEDVDSELPKLKFKKSQFFIINRRTKSNVDEMDNSSDGLDCDQNSKNSSSVFRKR